MSPEGTAAFKAFALKLLDTQTVTDAVGIFIDAMHGEPTVQEYADDFCGEAVLEKAKSLFRSLKPNVTTEHRHYTSRPEQKTLDNATLMRWGASVSAGYNFVLPTGITLGDATRDDLMKAAHTFSAHSKEFQHKARWLQLIAQGLPETQTVRERFTKIRLIELANAAEKATDIPA